MVALTVLRHGECPQRAGDGIGDEDRDVLVLHPPHLFPIHPQPQITCPSLVTKDTPTSLPALYRPQVHTPHLSHSSLLAFSSPSTLLRFPSLEELVGVVKITRI